jgi:drug/metabolite transporter (DMT)-like permease
MNPAYTWSAIGVIVVGAVAGDVLMAHAMRHIGDVGNIYRTRGLWHTVVTVIGHRWFLAALACMALTFFTLLVALSWDDLSLVGPAASALTYVGNAIGAKFFLREKVDTRRWVSALLVCGGVALLSI